jgi:hypothetical protein
MLGVSADCALSGECTITKEPARTDLPLIVYEAAGQTYLIDGTKRVNKWESIGDEGPHPVLIIRPK